MASTRTRTEREHITCKEAAPIFGAAFRLSKNLFYMLHTAKLYIIAKLRPCFDTGCHTYDFKIATSLRSSQ